MTGIAPGCGSCRARGRCFFVFGSVVFFDTAPYNRGTKHKGDACYVEHLARYQPRPHPTGGFRGRHRDPQRQQEEVRTGQGDRPHHPGPGALHLHPLPRQLRLHPPDLWRRRGSPGRAGGVLGVHRPPDPGALLPHRLHLHAGRGEERREDHRHPLLRPHLQQRPGPDGPAPPSV